MWERLKYTERFTFVDMSKVKLKSGLISISYLDVTKSMSNHLIVEVFGLG